MTFEIIDVCSSRQRSQHFVLRRDDELFLIDELDLRKITPSPKIGNTVQVLSNADYYDFIYGNIVHQVWDKVEGKIIYVEED